LRLDGLKARSEFIAFPGLRLGKQKGRAESASPLPSRLAAWVGAQVALQPCHIFRSGAFSLARSGSHFLPDWRWVNVKETQRTPPPRKNGHFQSRFCGHFLPLLTNDHILPGKNFMVAFQPGGKKMALFGHAWFFIYDEGKEDVCEIDLGTGRGGLNTALQAEWSPDGHYIALVTSAYNPGQLLQYSEVMVIDFETGKQNLIQVDAPFVDDFAWSSNNQFLAILGADQNEHNKGLPGSRIFVANILENSKPVMISDQLFGGGATEGWLLKWSPNGNEIVTKCPVWSKTEPTITNDNICIIDVTKKP